MRVYLCCLSVLFTLSVCVCVFSGCHEGMFLSKIRGNTLETQFILHLFVEDTPDSFQYTQKNTCTHTRRADRGRVPQDAHQAQLGLFRDVKPIDTFEQKLCEINLDQVTPLDALTILTKLKEDTKD